MADSPNAVEAFKASLGPDLEYLGNDLAPAITTLVDRVTHSSIERSLAPIRAASDALMTREAEASTTAILRSFGESHPDWKTHEPAMLALAEKLQPNRMSEGEYLDMLYRSVTSEQRKSADEAAIERKVNERVTTMKERRARPAVAVDFQQAAKDAIAGNRYDDAPDDADDGSTASATDRPAGASIRDAFRAAVAGVRWE